MNQLEFTDITAHLEPDSVVLRDPQGRRHLRILEQNYRADPVSQELLLSLYEGQTIEFLIAGRPEPILARLSAAAMRHTDKPGNAMVSHTI